MAETGHKYNHNFFEDGKNEIAYESVRNFIYCCRLMTSFVYFMANFVTSMLLQNKFLQFAITIWPYSETNRLCAIYQQLLILLNTVYFSSEIKCTSSKINVKYKKRKVMMILLRLS